MNKTINLPASVSLLAELDPDGFAVTVTASLFPLSDNSLRITVTGSARWSHYERNFLARERNKAELAFSALRNEKELTRETLKRHRLIAV